MILIDQIKDALLERCEKDPVTGCWNWKLRLNPDYGSFCFRKKQYKAHRMSYAVFNGPIPKDLFVLHKCDNSKCINPDHLFVGTQLDNIKDCRRKGRNNPNAGEQNGRATLTQEIANRIREEHAETHTSYSTLAELHNTNKSIIGLIIRDRTYKSTVEV